MASVTTAQLSADLDHALADFPVTLTVVSPASQAATEFAATMNTLTVSYLVEVNGREEEIDRRFYLNIDGVSTYPSKGWTFTTGGRTYKVQSQKIDSSGVLLALDCIGRDQRR
jgi:hypothetical protein